MKQILIIIQLSLFVLDAHSQNNLKNLKPIQGREVTENISSFINYITEGNRYHENVDKEFNLSQYKNWNQEEQNDFKRYAEIHGYWRAQFGCGWYCGLGDYNLNASSYSIDNNDTFSIDKIHDLDFRTFWISGPLSGTENETIEYQFGKSQARITHILILNGYASDSEKWKEYSRVKTMKLYYNDLPIALLHIDDSRHIQQFEVEPLGNDVFENYEINVANEFADFSDWAIKFEITDVYKGDVYDKIAISEIYFSGLDVHCFAKGTQITMADGSLKNIEDISQKDNVMTYDFNGQKQSSSRVSKLVSTPHHYLYELHFDDRSIKVTDDHPFWTSANEWASINPHKSNHYYHQGSEVSTLKIGDKVFVPAENTHLEIRNIIPVTEPQMAYTIELHSGNNFIANGFLVKTEEIRHQAMSHR